MHWALKSFKKHVHKLKSTKVRVWKIRRVVFQNSQLTNNLIEKCQCNLIQGLGEQANNTYNDTIIKKYLKIILGCV
jgi:hypothetical protein